MTEAPRPRPPRGRGSAAALAAAALLALAPAPAEAQESRAAARFEMSAGATSLRRDASALATASVLVGITPRLYLGGTGSVFLGTRLIEGSTRGNDLELRSAFGGLALHYRLADAPSLWLRLTAGAGNAKVDLAVARTRIAADNFVVLEPELGVSRPVAGPLHVGVAVGYRATLGVEDLPGVAPADLRGPTARLVLTALRF